MSSGSRRIGGSVLVPAGILMLSVIPLTAGALRLLQLTGGPDLMPADPRFSGFPIALVIHIVGAFVYVVFGVAQFIPRFRNPHATWHRRMGRVLAGAGLLVAGSALWITLVYSPKPGTGDLLYLLRLVFGSLMVAALVLGVRAARRRDFPTHRAWMIRAYALGLAAGTQVFTEGIATAAFGTSDLVGDLSKGAGWIINLTIAEIAIRRGAPQLSASRSATSSGLARATR